MVRKRVTRKSYEKSVRSPVRKSVKKLVVEERGRKVNWVLVLVMSIFFGMFGVDRFIMGKVGTGILKLLITILTAFVLGGWIWWLVDIILIASRQNFKGVTWVG